MNSETATSSTTTIVALLALLKREKLMLWHPERQPVQGELLMAANLRVYRESQEGDAQDKQIPTIPVRLGDLLPILTQAYRYHYTWLQDFLEDDVAVTQDLYEVIRSFRAYRPSA